MGVRGYGGKYFVIPDATTCHGEAESEDGSREPESRGKAWSLKKR